MLTRTPVLRAWMHDLDERGATATEYALLVGFIALVVVFGVQVFGQGLNDLYNDLAQFVQGLPRPG